VTNRWDFTLTAQFLKGLRVKTKQLRCLLDVEERFEEVRHTGYPLRKRPDAGEAVRWCGSRCPCGLIPAGELKPQLWCNIIFSVQTVNGGQTSRQAYHALFNICG
jgi:hypothetical protein